MNSFFALRYLNQELNAKLQGYAFVNAVSFRKNMLELFFDNGSDQLKLSVCTNPVRTALFFDPRTSVKKSNVVSFFERIYGEKVLQTEIADGDRILTFHFSGDEKLVFRLFGGDPNVFRVFDGEIRESFKNPDKNIGKEEPQPRKPEAMPLESVRGSLKKRIAKARPLIPRGMIDDLINFGQLPGKSDQVVEQFLDNVIQQMKEAPVARILSDGRFTIISPDFIPDPDAETFESVHDAVRVAFYMERSDDRYRQLTSQISRYLEKQEKKLRNLITAADNAHKSLERAEEYEKVGNLLMANAHREPDEDHHIEVVNFYDGNESLKITLEEGKSVAETAAWYFERKKKAERSFENLIGQKEISEKQLENLREITREFEAAGDVKAVQEFLEKYPEINENLSQSSGGDIQTRPYRTGKLGKFEIWLGRNAKSNDALVRDAHKEDIWMHARGVSGSHLVIRMNRSVTDPDKTVLEKAASWAAWNSKARGSELVPVIWTRRKYIRKPKGAAPGAVTVQREKVIMAEPNEPENAYFQ